MAWGDTHKRASFRGRRVRERLRRRRAVRLVVLLILGGGLLVGVWYGTRAKFVTITTVEVSGSTTIDLRAVEQEVQSILDGSYLFLIPKRFSYTYPHDIIMNTLEHLPRVAHATVTRTSRTVLSVALSEYTSYALWCQSVASSTAPDAPGPCLFISEEGFAFAEAPSLQGMTFLRYITPERNPVVGMILASADYIQVTKEFAHALLRAHHLQVYAITETSDGDLRYRVRGGGELLVDKDADMQEVFANLDAVLNSTEFKHLTSGNFVYIDLRFGNKVFVKEFASEGTTEDGEEQTEAIIIKTLE